MKGFLQEYGIIMVVVAVVLGMLAFGKSGFSKNIQEAILGSTNHIVETGENITDNLEVGTVIEIDGDNYIVMKKMGNGQYFMGTQRTVIKKNYQSSVRTDGRALNTYENSTIDNYLEKEWYPSLSGEMQNAIQPIKIKQSSYDLKNGKWSFKEDVPFGQTYNTLTRHAFVPSVEELSYIVDFSQPNKVRSYAQADYLWFRDSFYSNAKNALNINMAGGTLNSYQVDWGEDYIGVRPSFVLNVSQVNYKKVGEVNYK